MRVLEEWQLTKLTSGLGMPVCTPSQTYMRTGAGGANLATRMHSAMRQGEQGPGAAHQTALWLMTEPSLSPL